MARKTKYSAQWNELEADDLVKIEAEPDESFELDEEFENDEQKQDALDSLERDGAWGIVGYYRLDPDDEWIQGDSVWGFYGYNNVLNEKENPYVTDIKSETIEAYYEAFEAEDTSG